MPALAPITLHDARAAIHGALGDRTDRCKRLSDYAVSCRNVTPRGLIVTYDDGSQRRLDLVMRVTATRVGGRWHFELGDVTPPPFGFFPRVRPDATKEAGNKGLTQPPSSVVCSYQLVPEARRIPT